MNDLTAALVGALLATNQPAAVSNLIEQQTGFAVPVAADPAEQQLHSVMAGDDAALDEINAWITTNRIPRADTNALAQLNLRIRQRLDVQKHSYDLFLRNHPDRDRKSVV